VHIGVRTRCAQNVHKMCTKCAQGGVHTVGCARGCAHGGVHKVCPKCAHGGVHTVMCTRRGSLGPGRHMAHSAEPQAAAIIDRGTVGPCRRIAAVLACGQGMMGCSSCVASSSSVSRGWRCCCCGALMSTTDCDTMEHSSGSQQSNALALISTGAHSSLVCIVCDQHPD